MRVEQIVRILTAILWVAVPVFVVILILSLLDYSLVVELLGAWWVGVVYGGSVGMALICAGIVAWYKSQMKSPKLGGRDEYDIVSATWILANRDDTPLMFYDDVAYRLGLPDDYDVENRVVLAHRELFRHGVSEQRLENWKCTRLKNLGVPDQRLKDLGCNMSELSKEPKRPPPRWITRKAENEGKEPEALIGEVEEGDVFRSQFRIDPRKANDLPPIEIIQWGLEYLDRRRKARLEAREATAKSWQIWLVFGVGLLNIIVAFFAALISSIS
jgi:hypothetical protein